MRLAGSMRVSAGGQLEQPSDVNSSAMTTVDNDEPGFVAGAIKDIARPRIRRAGVLMLGLFAFYYGSLHLLTYVVADRLAGLEFKDGILAWTTARDLVAAVRLRCTEAAVYHDRLHGVAMSAAAGDHIHSGNDSPPRWSSMACQSSTARPAPWAPLSSCC